MGNLMSNWGDEIAERQHEESLAKRGECPECGSTKLTMERCINGHTICQNCGRKRKHKDFYRLDSKLSNEPENPHPILWIDSYDENKKIQCKGDYILANGGDGTLLKAINMFRDQGKPFYGRSAGTVNFLMNDEKAPIESAKYKKFHLIKVKVTYHNFRNLETAEYQAFNEVMMGGDMNSFIDFNVHDKDAIIGQFKGGGVIISTAQGSTGINKNNGGAILPLSSDQWYITSDKCNRDISVPIEPKRTSITAKSRGPITVWIDGQNHIIKDVEKIELSKGDEVTVIFNDYDKFKRKRRV